MALSVGCERVDYEELFDLRRQLMPQTKYRLLPITFKPSLQSGGRQGEMLQTAKLSGLNFESKSHHGAFTELR